ncbi:MAG: hypothetical protein ACREA0_28500, partial [bacterium]
FRLVPFRNVFQISEESLPENKIHAPEGRNVAYSVGFDPPRDKCCRFRDGRRQVIFRQRLAGSCRS